ncbi:MAG TPA: error-prone DNA polymerase [Luteitalea sp.]|nr:error-prone DNA polymerase [Luteitalea sp.]
MYVELHAASAFSFLDGASLPEALVDQAKALGYDAIALLDRDGVYGAPRFYQAARKAGLRALVGAELTMQTGSGRAGSPSPAHAQVMPLHPPLIWRLPVIVASSEGYRSLCRLVTRMKLAAAKGQGALTLHDLDGHVAGLIAVAGRPMLAADRHGVAGLLDRIVGVFGRANVYVEIQRHLTRDEAADNRVLTSTAEAYRVPVVATNGVRFATPDARPLYDVLTCIRHGTTLANAGRRLAANAERYLKSPAQMQALFSDMPGAIAGTRALADRLEFTLADLGYRFPDYPVPEGESQMSFLRRITEAGAHWRYRPLSEKARRQIDRELDLIEKLDLAGYFLIVWDLVNFCRQHDILAQGRGSAANSAVCYSLGITAVDPVGMELLFERFLSEERGEWPDIDLDLPSGDRREQAIQYLYTRYGDRGAAMTANVITYRGRSAAREVGKVLGCPPDMVDTLAKVMSPFEWQDPKDTLSRHMRDLGVDPDLPQLQQFGDLWFRMQDIPRHLGQHSGGMVLCQGRLDDVVPLEPASMPGRVVVQWDKEDCADMGIVKVDLLGLGMLAVLQESITIVNTTAAQVARASGMNVEEEPPPVIDLAHLPPDDPVVYQMLQEADTVGLFQVESRAQMATLPRLKPTCFYDLVVEVAIIRPGPIVGQMVHPYLARRRGDEPVAYAHPSLEPILKRTLGVPLFQEQLLRMAMVVAGFTGGEAEELRRAMGFKRSEARMRQIEVRLREGMAARGIVGDTAETILRSISSFALYGFPESHAASFALIVYASAYLKAYYPSAFYTGLLNNQPLGFYHPATLIKDAQRHGVRFLPVDVQHSTWDCHITTDGAVRLGFCMVQGLREDVGRKLEKGTPNGRGTTTNARPTAGVAAGLVRRSPDSSSTDDRPPTVDGRLPRVHEGRRPNDEGRNGVPPLVCPKCGVDDQTMFEIEAYGEHCHVYCSVCAHDWASAPGTTSVPAAVPEGTSASLRRPSPVTDAARSVFGSCSDRPERGRGTASGPYPLNSQTADGPVPTAGRDSSKAEGRMTTADSVRFPSLDALVAATGIRRDELTTLASLGALNVFGTDRRGALWNAERAVRPTGDLFALLDEDAAPIRVGSTSSEPLVAVNASLKTEEGRGASLRRPSAGGITADSAEMARSASGPYPQESQSIADLSRRSLGVSEQAQADGPLPTTVSVSSTANCRPPIAERDQSQAVLSGRSRYASEQATADGRLPTAESAQSKAQGPRPKADLSGRSRDVSEQAKAENDSPLPPMSSMERIVADYRGSGVTIGPHPMALRRADLRLRGVMRSDELVRTRRGRRVRVAGAVITRQRPGTAKGMVFLTLEDEVGLANVIIRPDVFDRQRPLIMRAPFLVVEGVLQQQEGVTSVRAERVMGFGGDQPTVPSHDFR